MKQYQHLVAKHSYASLMDAGQLLARLGYGITPDEVASEVSQLVHALCDKIIWADRQLNWDECGFLDALFQEDAAHGGKLRRLVQEKGSGENFLEEIPELIRIAVLHDKKSGTWLAVTILNSLENLGWILVGIDGSNHPAETEMLESYCKRLREFISSARSVVA
jgi:hypothetical protein